MAKSLSKSVAWYGLGNLFIRSVSFVLLPFYSNLISTSEFGNYALLMSVYAIISVLYQFGMHGTLNKFYIEEYDEGRRKIIFSTLLNFIILFGVIFTVLFCLTAKPISEIVFGSTKYSSLFILIFNSLLIETLCFYILLLLKTKELSRLAVTYSGTGAILNLIFNIVFVFILRLSVAGIIFAQLISSMILLVIMLKVIRDDYVLKLDTNILKVLLKFAYPLLFAGFLSAAVDVADRFILNYFLGTSEVGIYSLAYRIAMVMNVFVISFRTAWNPYSLNLFYSENYKSTYGVTLSKLVAISCIILLTVSLFSKYLFEINLFGFHLFNPMYKSGIIILPLVLTGYIFSGISSFYSVYPNISNKSFHFLASDLIAFVSNIIVNLIFIPKYGIIGAAFATAIGFLFGAAYLFFISRDQIKIDYQTKNLSIIILSALIFLFAGLNLRNIFADFISIGGYLITLRLFVKLKVTKMFRLNS
jgi:O-antigen/teichoic acid export membrane protein